jgi:hypothetical protein
MGSLAEHRGAKRENFENVLIGRQNGDIFLITVWDVRRENRSRNSLVIMPVSLNFLLGLSKLEMNESRARMGRE